MQIHAKDVRSNLVTEADTRSEALIRQMIADEYPADSVLGRRANDEDQGPVAGSSIHSMAQTMRSRLPLFGVSIAYEMDGVVLVGAVCDPWRARWRGGRNSGAMQQRPPWVSGCSDLRDALVVTGFPPVRDAVTIPNFRTMERFMHRAQAVRRDGSAALDLCYVAAGRFDGFWEAGLHAWDIAAGALIVSEAGGHVTDYSGLPLRIDCGELLATNALVHDAMLDVLRDGD